ncbi:uncharacterized protein UMAG_04755 [Mycosarcoma maydis]|uniref:Protein kinase domain-containing protein n=1 Tax=Mycosarcoma maydis TaxID=5270 RepID=A0A0D1BXP5_MYCMD|nr:uncharacterized protein UMAG_04755 [Ustilago maydis 521]KIS66692.1 hypothetical protein UMAG_04755 [Ustilago maydis 521]|eukprot:XP_011391632.1 hypothetical protein UMAG_04755 [Ustilago maydis 521]
MSQFLSGSPEADDQLPSFMEQRLKAKASASRTTHQASADPSESTPHRKDTLSASSDTSAQSSLHSHHHSHSHSGHHHSHPHASANSSLGVSGAPHERTLSRSMTRSSSHDYRETLDAKSKDLEDGSTVINQYTITDTIGRGAYGIVRKAVLTEEPDVKFAVKEFGKTRLRKTHRAERLRKSARSNARPHPANRTDPTKGGPGPDQDDQNEANDPLSLIRHEIAILKKLHHPHVVQLFEVLDDPAKDNLYMVFEYCPDGTVIDVKPNEKTEPLPEDVARLYFVQILMGIEYLHENEIVHRDIKPDNILLSDNRKTCKIVDFGVSEMFLKPGDDTMQKSAGSPAFMSPELCTAGHAEYHGKSDDVWSFGVTLYCMVVGHLPFNKDNFYEMYESIKNDEPEYPDHLSNDLKDLLQRMFTKDPAKRITVPEMRQHPWTRAVEEGILLSKEDNLQAVVSEITDEDLDCAICKITNIFTFARAISRFRKGGSLQRARKETLRSTSGGSSNNDSSGNDRSWFPSSSCSPAKTSRSNTKDSSLGGDTAAKSLVSDVATIKEETPTPASQDTQLSDAHGANENKQADEAQALQKAAAVMFESPQLQTFELPPEEPDSNGPLKRNRSGPVSTLHKLDTQQQSTSLPVITMESPHSANVEVVASRTSEGGFCFGECEMDTQTTSRPCWSVSVHASDRGTDGHGTYTADTVRPDDAIACQLSDMMLEHRQERCSGLAPAPGAAAHKDATCKQHTDEGDSLRRRIKTLQERAASLGEKKSKAHPKLLPDQPTFESPRHEINETPCAAADVCARRTRSAGEDENPYFRAGGCGDERQDAAASVSHDAMPGLDGKVQSVSGTNSRS